MGVDTYWFSIGRSFVWMFFCATSCLFGIYVALRMSIEVLSMIKAKKETKKGGFTLIEMMIVVLIISILSAICFGIYSHSRIVSWRQKTRDTARQIAIAWNWKLLNNHEFPNVTNFTDAVVSSSYITFLTIAENMGQRVAEDPETLNEIHKTVLPDGTTHTNQFPYIDQNAQQRIVGAGGGMRDKWGNLFHVMLDTSYGGTVINPMDGAVIHANVIVWSMGEKNSTNSAIVASP